MLYSLTVNDTYFTSDNLTDGVTAMLITTSDGELGIRVMWSIKPEHQDCQFATLRVGLNDNEVSKNISVHEIFKDFSEASDRLGCNREYTPRVRAILAQEYPELKLNLVLHCFMEVRHIYSQEVRL